MRLLVKAAALAATIFLASCATTQPTMKTCPNAVEKPACHANCKAKDHTTCMNAEKCKNKCTKSCKKKHHKHKSKAKAKDAALTTDTAAPAAATTDTTAPATQDTSTGNNQ